MKKDRKIIDWAGAEQALGAIAGLEAQGLALRAEADEEINQVRGRLKQGLDIINGERETLEASLQEFALERRGEFEPQKSRKLRFGTIGFRSVPRFVWPRKNETLLQRLRELKLSEYIRVKEEPDKQGIIAHHESLPLKELGVKRRVEEDFYIEVDSSQ